MKKRISFILALVILASIFNINIIVNAKDIINKDMCFSYLSMDFETGDILYSYNADRRIYPASTTKLMTALVAIEKSPLNKVFTTSLNATRFLEEGSGELDLEPNETMDFYSLLHGLLIRSFNDVALVIAENIAGSEEAFIDMMNEKAVLLGAFNTHFVAPHGLHDDEHYTTAEDLAIIAKNAFSNFTIATICAKPEYSLPATNLRESFKPIKNTNLILGTNTGYDFTVIAGKTGFTSKAQNVLIALSTDFSGREVLTVVAGVKDRVEIGDLTLELMKSSYMDYGVQCIAKAGEIMSLQEGIQVANAVRLEHLMPYDIELWTLDKTIEYRDDIIYPNVDIGDILGTVTYSYNGNYIGQSYIVAASTLKPDEIKTEKIIINNTTASLLSAIDGKKPFPLEFVISLGISLLILVMIIFVFYKTKRRTVKTVDNTEIENNDE